MTTWMIAISVSMIGLAEPSPWHQDYVAAVRAARTADKPILAIFTDKADAKDRKEQLSQIAKSANGYVLLYGNKNTDEGKRLFETFSVATDNAVVIVDRGIEWQCRYERELSVDELGTLISNAVGTKGKPANDILANANGSNFRPDPNIFRSSFYTPPSDCAT